MQNINMKKNVVIINRVFLIALLLNFVNNMSIDNVAMLKKFRAYEKMMKVPRNAA